MKLRFTNSIIVMATALLLAGCFKDPVVIPAPENPYLHIDSLKVLASDIPSADYTDMTFVNEQTGYAVSVEGDIIKTVDGGIHWQQLSVPVHTYLHRIQFVTPTIGYVIGGVDTVPSGFLLKTTDAGLTWQRISLHTPLPGAPTGISFTDALTGYVTGKNFFRRTSDGGNTWTDVPGISPEDFTDVKFLDGQKGYAIAKNGTFYKTVNGGNSWQTGRIPSSSPLGEIVPDNPKAYVRVGSSQVADLETGIHAFFVPAAAARVLLLPGGRCVGIGQHYENGFWPYGDIFISNDSWQTNVSKRFEPGQAVNFRAIAMAGNHKIVMLGTGLLQSTLVQLKY